MGVAPGLLCLASETEADVLRRRNAERRLNAGFDLLEPALDGMGELAEEAEFAGHLYAEVFVGQAGSDATTGSAVQETDLNEERFVDLFEGVLLLCKGGGEGVEADGAAVILLNDGAEEAAVELVEAVGIDL